MIEGAFDDYSLMIVSGTLAKAKMMYIESAARSRMRFDADRPVVATSQGMWPGIHVEKGGSATAGPTANPWIDTNTGFLRFARASTDAAIWIAVQPPADTVQTVEHYVQAIGDAAINGARWVLSLDEDFSKRLLARQPRALADWARIVAALRHFEDHREWRSGRPAGEVALIQDLSNARFSGGLFDMLAAKHVPVFALPVSRLSAAALQNAKIAVSPEPSLAGPQSPALQSFSRSGNALIEGPPAKKRAAQPDEDFVYDPSDTRPNVVWQELSDTMGRQNFGVRLFNVASMLSNLLALTGQRQLVLHIVNYSDYPASGITARVTGEYRRARLHRPGEPAVDMETEKVEGGTAFSIDQRVTSIATVVLE